MGNPRSASDLPCAQVNLFRVVRARRKACDRRQLRDNILDNRDLEGPHALDRPLREDIRNVLAQDVRGKVRADRARGGRVLAGQVV